MSFGVRAMRSPMKRALLTMELGEGMVSRGRWMGKEGGGDELMGQGGSFGAAGGAAGELKVADVVVGEVPIAVVDFVVW